jgi:hypothetical protein
MHSEAATIGEMDHPVMGSTARRTVAIVVVGAVVGSGGEHPERHMAGYAGILQADAFDGYNRLYLPDRKPGPIVEALCWSHARRKFFELADAAANARRGKTATPISPIALEGADSDEGGQAFQ